MNTLVLSDKVIPFIYSPQVRERFGHVDLVLSCGDLAYYYLEYVLNALDVTLFFVRGNHDKIVEYSQEGLQRTRPHGAVDLHRRVIQYNGLLVAGIEGAVRYRPGKFQYSQGEMWRYMLSMTPRLMVNRIVYGRFLDVFISHAPPAGIHDQEDYAHRGARAFRWLINVFQPSYFFHGHVHVIHPKIDVETRVGKTRVINAYGFRELVLDKWQK